VAAAEPKSPDVVEEPSPLVDAKVPGMTNVPAGHCDARKNPRAKRIGFMKRLAC
jgi:hypothetical protein